MKKYQELMSRLSDKYDTELSHMSMGNLLFSESKPRIQIYNNFSFHGKVTDYYENRVGKRLEARAIISAKNEEISLHLLSIILPYGSYSLSHKEDEICASRVYGSGHVELSAVLSGVLTEKIQLDGDMFSNYPEPIDNVSELVRKCDEWLTTHTHRSFEIDDAYLKTSNQVYCIKSRHDTTLPSIQQFGY